ncbi:MAG: hypothetical protein MJA27_07320 [Pseudanabaenales cyanobacterium]|nr:hypothetical protein [Pseudanabaenales cyanobacterium]
MTGGGAFDLWQGFGNLLTASYPIRQVEGAPYTGWAAAGKDHIESDPAPLAVYAIGIKITNNGQPVSIQQQVVSAKGPTAAHPKVTAHLPDEWIGTGGGAIDNYSGEGNMLTASYPVYTNGKVTGWTGMGKDHIQSDPSTITAFVIGIQVPDVTLDVDIVSVTGKTAAHPVASVSSPTGHTVVGGGAIDNYSGEGNMLTATYPLISSSDGTLTGWSAAGKDHIKSDPSSITVYVVTLEAVPV